TGGTSPYTFSGVPPTGLSLSPSGAIAGTVAAFVSAGPAPFFVTVTDSHGVSSSKSLSIDVIGVPVALPSIDLSAYNNLDDCTIGVKCSRGIGVRRGGAVHVGGDRLAAGHVHPVQHRRVERAGVVGARMDIVADRG